MDDDEFIEQIKAFLRSWRTAGLATVNADAEPHAANVQYALGDDESLPLYFVSSLRSAHSQHIALEPRIAMTIYAHTDEPDQIHGVQLHGLCARIDDAVASHHAWNVYTKRFPFITENPLLEERVRGEQFYRVTPTWLRWIDNRRGFGFKLERSLTV